MTAPALRVLHERGPRGAPWHGGGAGWLSVKSMRGGAHYVVEGRAHYAVHPGRVLLLNDAQPYEVTVQPDTESYCVFLNPAFVAAAWTDRRTPLMSRLDDPHGAARVPELLVRTYPDTSALAGALRAVQLAPDPARDEAALHLLSAVWAELPALNAQLGALPWVRAATREEVLRRVTRAREYADAHPFTEGVTTLAAVANLSPAHFVRAFHAVVGVPPGAYLTGARLDLARAALRGGADVLTAAATAGYASPTSFAAAYRRRFGRPPGQDRRPRL